MTPAPFKSQLLSRASARALTVCLRSRRTPASDTPALGFIARIRLWLCLLWGGSKASAIYRVENRPSLNRAAARLKKRGLPLARGGNPIAAVLRRVMGRARYLRFIYDECLTGRVRWCFSGWNWKWPKRVFYIENPLTRRKKRAALARSSKPRVELSPD